MTKKILILTVGLPRSGKSTWAKQQIWPIVNRDAIRLALHGQAYIAQSEEMVTAIESYMVRALFLAGHDHVIVDATHLQKKYRKRWNHGPWEVRYKLFDVSSAGCIARAERDDRKDLIPVIERMAANIEWPEQEIPMENFLGGLKMDKKMFLWEENYPLLKKLCRDEKIPPPKIQEKHTDPDGDILLTVNAVPLSQASRDYYSKHRIRK